MKKFVVLIIVILICSLVLVGCTSAPVPGTSWAQKETIVYNVTDGDKNVGKLTTVIDRLEEGNQTLTSVRPEPFVITSSVTKGSRVTTTLEQDGKVVMYSESLLNGFKPLASYKKVDYNDQNYEIKSFFDKKYYNYTLTNNDGTSTSDKIKAKGDIIDNELIYTFLRCYDVESNKFSKSIQIPSPKTDSLETLSVTYGGVSKIAVPYREGRPEVECTKLNISRTSSPVGSPYTIYYSPANKENTIYGAYQNKHSYRMPIKIVENNMVYMMESITVI